MSLAQVLCLVPAERAHLVASIQKAGAIAVVDFTTSGKSGKSAVPAGAWVRVLDRRNVPGDGPVLLVKGTAPVSGRPTWLEVTDPRPAPSGFAGIVLRGSEAGGPCGKKPGLDLLRDVPKDQAVILASGPAPEEAAQAIAAGASGVLLSDVLLALPELDLPSGLRGALDRADDSTSHVVNGFRIQASPLAPVLRKLLAGEPFWENARDWFKADDPANVAWPAGFGLTKAKELARRAGSLEGLVALYQQAIQKRTTGPGRVAPTAASPSTEAIAIIGMGCRMPGAGSLAEFWDNIKAGRSAITEVPVERWDPTLYWDPDRKEPDKTYAKIGGFLSGFVFNPRRFRIPPAVAKTVDPVQQVALEAVADALDDAGYGDKREFDRTRVGVILGNSMGGEQLGTDYEIRVHYPAMRKALQEVPDFAALPRAVQTAILGVFEHNIKDDLTPLTEDSMPGELSNVIAGRVANAFNLAGPNFTVDAACASSIAAIQTAVKGLQDGDFDLAVTGGSDRTMGVATYAKFSKIGALSADHSAPFDETADGFVMGEGAGILILKRLPDALRDGDRVYAVIRGMGGSSDGKGKGITAPNIEGQKLALRRAYAEAGIDPVEVDLFECHGTSTVVGDKVEVEALTDVIGENRRGARGPIRIGSVKSMIGHLKSAAGAASFIKVAMALHENVLPPSINFKKARADVPLDRVPLQVQTKTEPWTGDHPHYAGVSAFGFGGTNFHAVLEAFDPARHAASVSAKPAKRAAPPMLAGPTSDYPVPHGIWAVSADTAEDLVEALRTGGNRPFDPSSPIRMAAVAASQEEKSEQIARALKVLEKGQSPDLLRARGIAYEDTAVNGKLCFLFTGQGSQYIDMALDLAEAYSVVRDTFAEADAVMQDETGRTLTSYIRRDPSIDENDQFEALRATQISQPATLMVDVAILRLMAGYGIYPDVVAGHSLGEYAAAVAAGILSFKDALLAVSARGREMAAIEIPDPGRMVGIASGVDTVQEVLAEIPGYVIAANKNCPTQTVIAGDSEATDAAIEAFKSRGITVYPLPVSHAFHSRIVAPASAPLKKVLGRLDIKAPQRPITTNVTSKYYPTGPGAKAEVIDILAQQVASPVEWMAQIERMYADGSRIFVECGPKRALTGFTVSILKRRPHRALYTNHPKRGGVTSFLDALAGLVALGFPVKAEADRAVPDLFVPMAPRLATNEAIATRMEARTTGSSAPADGGEATDDVVRTIVAIIAEATAYSPQDMRLDDDLEADLGVDTVKQAEIVAKVRDRFRLDHDPGFRLGDYRTLRDLANYAARRLGSTTVSAVKATPVEEDVEPSVERLPLARVEHERPSRTTEPSISPDVLQALARGAVEAGLSGGAANDVASAMLPAIQSLVAALQAALPKPAPAVAESPALPKSAPPPAVDDRALPIRRSEAPPAPREVEGKKLRIVCSGAAIGLPGGNEVFAADNIQAILEGQNRITIIPDADQDRILSKRIVRLQKDARTGQGDFIEVNERADVLKLAGRRAHFDLVGDYAIAKELVEALDITTQLAFAAAFEALRDAGVPLVRSYRETKGKKRVPTGWALPEPWRDGTGIVFASAFPGYSKLVEHMRRAGTEPFDRRFLFQILAMGHSQLAQNIGARGPNTQVNAACASTTQAISIAEDWMRMGRAERVIVVGADDVTNDELLEWIGAGFLVTGAATTSDKVEEAALPFDRRRHGMILGMGAVGMILEKEEDVRARGMAPIARLLTSRMANSAFHGTRLHPEHIASEVDALVADATEAAGIDRKALAEQSLFMSHETYTPAKGGSAAAEIESLRVAFGPAAKQVVITNTKGFTGHPMGAGIEDAIAVKALQYQRVPPIPNLQEPDPDLGDLTLSRGGKLPVRYAIRLAAGFGSQLALTVWEKIAIDDRRIEDQPGYDRWLASLEPGTGRPRLAVEHRTLRLHHAAAEQPREAQPATVTKAAPSPRSSAPSREQVVASLVELIATKTGYEKAEIDPEYELEADLGIDTVKQAEIFGEVRDRYGLARDDDFKLTDYPTITKLAGWLADRAANGPAAAEPERDAPAAPPPREETADDETVGDVPTPTIAAPMMVAAPQALDVLVELISQKTGYSVDELDPTYELEADLGIDTVKLAEIFGEVRERFAIPKDDGFKLAEYPTIEKLAAWLDSQATPATETAPPTPAPAPSPPRAPSPRSVRAPEAPQSEDLFEPQSLDRAPEDETKKPGAPPASGAVLPELLSIISARTGYEVAELDPGFELEADLGIDTVKQAEIFGEVRDRFAIPRDDDFKLADYPTIEKLAAWLEQRAVSASAAQDLDEALPDEPTDPGAAIRSPPPQRDRTTGDLPLSFRIRRPVLVDRASHVTEGVRGRSVLVLGGDGALVGAIHDELESHGARAVDAADGDARPDAVIDLGMPLLDAFALAQRLHDQPPRMWMCVTRLGADSSWADLGTGAASGARAGFAKAIGREWDATQALVLDLDPDLKPNEAAAMALSELAGADGTTEVFRDGQRRRIVELRTEPFPPRKQKLPDPQVVVLTGGTRGVTARVAKALARRGPVKLALLARSTPGEMPLDEAAAKNEIRSDLQAKGERATPAQIEERLAPLRVAEEARQTIAELESLGAEVRFYALDLADRDAIERALAAVARDLGRITGVVHGAGIEKSRLVQDKDATEFARVFDGKARGGLALAELVEPDAWFVSMGSVAGRFGNAGQVDYSAANEALARVCMSRSNSLHVDWTAWGDVGMAVRGGMKKLLTDRGVELMPADAGADLLVDMIAARMTGELLVAGKLGELAFKPSHALLDGIELDGDGVIVWRTLSRASDPWIYDHAIDGTPILPGVIGVELMAAAAIAARPGSRYVGARDVRFLSPVKIHRDEPLKILVSAKPIADRQIRCVLSSERVARTGRQIVADHFEGTILVDHAELVEALPSAFFPDETISRGAIYRRFFHGPAFQVLQDAGGVARQGLLVDAIVEHAFIASALVTRPLILEAAFQAAGLHRMAVAGVMALPASIDLVLLGSHPSDGAVLHLMARATTNAAATAYDVDVDGPDGAVLRLRGFRMIDTGPLPPGDRIPEPQGGWPEAIVAATATSSSADDDLLGVERAELSSRGTERRQRDRLAGQIAAKQAVREVTGAPGDTFRITREPSGRPVVVGLDQAPDVTISHRDGHAVAVAVREGRAGIDLEAVEPRAASFGETWLSASERELVGGSDVRLAQVWAVKEAVLKALGTGMALRPQDVIVTALDDPHASVLLHGDARERHQALGGGSLTIRLARRDHEVLALALIAA
jgi:acyl transferase domain-containing protein/NAD(P)-dependent dehydrogenase (short-subunit alcohol dehydrogenase family)/phosphopantetheinyl transferase